MGMTDADWAPYRTPVLLQRNFTILGTRDAMVDWPELDLGFVKAKVLLGPGTILNFSRVVIIKSRNVPPFQPVGMDLIVSVPRPGMSTNTSRLGIVASWGAVNVWIPGHQTLNTSASLPVGDCVDDPSARLVKRCWPAVGLNADVAVDGMDTDPNDKTVYNGYLIWAVDFYYLCQTLMTPECVLHLATSTTASTAPLRLTRDELASMPVTPLTPFTPGIMLDVGLVHEGAAGGGRAVSSDGRASGANCNSSSAATVELSPTVLGKGAFGRVVVGTYKGVRVAVKLINTGLLAAPGGGAGASGAAFAASGAAADEALAAAQYASDGSGTTHPRMLWHRHISPAIGESQDPMAGPDAAIGESQDPMAGPDAAIGESQDPMAGPDAAIGESQDPMAGPDAAIGESQDPMAGPDAAIGESQDPMAGPDAAIGESQAEATRRGGKRPNGVGSHAALFMGTLAQEVEVLARCRHPNVVRLLAANLTPPRVCLVMELMDTSLDRLLHGGGAQSGALPGRMALHQVLHIALQVARALAYLHPTILHRDLKPANVLVSEPNSATPVVKLADFGLSRLHNTVVITRNPAVGTAPYMAPEVFDVLNQRVTDKVDIWAFGVILWEMLTGQRPWPGLDPVQIACAISIRGARLPLESLPPERCPAKLRALLTACWEQDPSRRPAAAEVVKTLALVQEVSDKPTWA
ncbi:hypothetical protein GPECTOR_74g681 [Gonium pectorale]|uniref:Protein kinase domain-containing protein n=1 Tax=Gonium pectorale TaxID=33097 RepID=A0A150G2J2_GONPE|nr:hypothetical protein GPECTOR_74g681 [Gonium pectorale]|eukprot:KXZ44067.1 hypothetical protein GPECTOR_74g681 [Gonium pectorale]